ncbi:hypothetical protein [Mucilaginibacter auburnensis]|uniref:Uncharacterized protein n=1 Tax=Mucilaginibacter auburnensis TaxID=1457233 RepID=A0A2H9VRL9_9SPHI|nr:hypothetical protein [Mucilaginibacter auburnensis]PJJ83461.1 hypothetical protein CLV57_0443 [Mucilaginibacter auburnensis]
MNFELLSPRVKQAGYLLLMISAIGFFINTSGILMLIYPPKKFDNQFALASIGNSIALVLFALAIVFIVVGKAKKDYTSLSNRLLLPHYFKYAGYIYLFFTLIYAVTNYKHRYVRKEEWFTHVMIPSYQAGLTDEQNKVFNSMKDGGIVVHSNSIIITPFTMILPVGLLFLAFAKERVEDELISKYRTQSLQLAILLLFFIVLYQKFNVPEIKTLILTSKKGIGYFDIPGTTWRADVLINVVLIFSILRMEYMLRIKPLFSKHAES